MERLDEQPEYGWRVSSLNRRSEGVRGVRVGNNGVGRRPVRPGGRFGSRELQLRGYRELRLRAAVRVMHQLMRGVSLTT